MTPDDLDALHDYWFGQLSGRDHFPGDRFPLWFDNTPGRDSELRQRFGPLLDGAPGRPVVRGMTWQQRLGLILLFDQIPRALFRGTPQAYEHDAIARRQSRALLGVGLEPLAAVERVFAILPLGHSENMADQDRALEAYESWVVPVTPPGHPFYESARRQSQLYHEIIRRFGRFPFRNGALGRQTTPEEAEFLAGLDLPRY